MKGDRSMKKLISLLLAMTMIVPVTSVCANAESSENQSTYQMIQGWDLDFSGDGMITGADEAMYLLFGFYLSGDWDYMEQFDKMKITADFNSDGVLDYKDTTIFVHIFSGGLYDCIPGDVNLDGILNGTDATLVLQCYTQISSGVPVHEINYGNLITRYGDMDGDGIITGADATAVLRAYTQLSSQ